MKPFSEGVRNYYRRLGYVLRGDGQYLIKELGNGSAPENHPVEAHVHLLLKG